MVVWGPVRRAGLYRLDWTEPGGSTGSAEVAVNMVSKGEGRIGAREEIEFSIDTVSGNRAVRASRNALWPWLLGIGLLFLLLEWYVYFRKAA
jgi:hypothetical protein